MTIPHLRNSKSIFNLSFKTLLFLLSLAAQAALCVHFGILSYDSIFREFMDTNYYYLFNKYVSCSVLVLINSVSATSNQNAISIFNWFATRRLHKGFIEFQTSGIPLWFNSLHFAPEWLFHFSEKLPASSSFSTNES